ncbi:MAG: complement resistance protein TraT [Syntrophobacteraceae bacterium]|jgi:hypothetical protein
MRRNRSITSALVPCIFALVFISLSCCPATTEAQHDWGAQSAKPAAKTPAYTPPPDLMIYFRTGPKEKSVNVAATNINVPGLPSNLNYFKQTDEMLEDVGYVLPDNPARAAVQVRVNVKYTQVDNSQKVANEVGGKAIAGAVLGALTGLAAGGGGQGAAEGATGGAAYGVASGAAAPPVLKYLTFEFEISSKAGGTQVGQITKDITEPTMGVEEFIDAVIADYLEAAFPKKRH